jgi:GT2 family glycosyltransferase
LVDDGSTDGTTAAVKDAFGDRIDVVYGSGQLYWAAGMAEAERRARLGSPDYLLWLNDDVELRKSAIQVLLETARENPHCVVAGAVEEFGSDQIAYSGVNRQDWHPMRFRMVSPSGVATPTDTMHGNVVLVPRAVYETVSVDGEFGHAYADYDYGLRARKAGYGVVLAPHVVGCCSSNPITGSFEDVTLGLRHRLDLLADRKGRPLPSQARYLRRHGGSFWPLFIASPYVRVIVQWARQGLRSGR